jgi:hypothetical protein
MLGRRFRLVLVALLLSAHVAAQNCEAFLNHGLYNVETRSSQDQLNQHLFTELCSESFDVRNLSEGRMKSFGGSLGYAGFSVGASSSGGSSRSEFEEARSNFCNTTRSDTSQSAATRSEVRTLFPQALQVYERCLTLESRGLRISYSITPSAGEATSVTYGLSRSTGPDVLLTGVHIVPRDAFTCVGRVDAGGAVVEFDATTTARVTNNQISMTCTRNAVGGVYEGAAIAIHTNDENLVTYFERVPQLPEVQASRAADLEAQVRQLEARLLHALDASTKDVDDRLSSLTNRVDQVAAGRLRAASGRSEIVTFRGGAAVSSATGGNRDVTGRVEFPNAFGATPAVLATISALDTNIVRYRLRITGRDANGFDWHLRTWAQTEIYSAEMSWIAVGTR